jgi:hypothetical protein
MSFAATLVPIASMTNVTDESLPDFKGAMDHGFRSAFGLS